MPWSIGKSSQCPTNKPWAVIKKGGKVVGCHDSEASARQQQKALYAAESRKKMSDHPRVYVAELPKQFSETEGLTWIHALPYGEWDHPKFGMTVVDEQKVDNFVKNFTEGTTGIELSTDYEHGLDPARGAMASGTIKAMRKSANGLWVGVEPTARAKAELDAGEWRYFSGEFWEEWEDPHSGSKTKDVFTGGGFTNKPWVKTVQPIGTALPINFSELVVEKEAAVENESVEKEHSEPGTGAGGEPEPRETGDNEEGEQGTRGPDPEEEDEEVRDSLDTQLRDILGLDPDADIVKAIKGMKEEVTPIREAAKAHSEKKAFAELYPREAKRLAELETTDRESRAKSFSESYANVKDGDGRPTGKGFSGLVLDKLEMLHKSFSEGTANINDVKDVLDAIGQNGLVDYTERGTTYIGEVQTGETATDAPKLFAEKIVQIQTADKLNYKEAAELAAQRFPQLAQAYHDHFQAVRS